MLDIIILCMTKKHPTLQCGKFYIIIDKSMDEYQVVDDSGNPYWIRKNDCHLVINLQNIKRFQDAINLIYEPILNG